MIHLLFALFVALQVADYATTMKGFKRGAREGNPIVRAFQSKLGAKGGTAAAKIVATVFIAVMVYLYHIPAWALGVLCAGYGAVVAWNLRTLRKQFFT